MAAATSLYDRLRQQIPTGGRDAEASQMSLARARDTKFKVPPLLSSSSDGSRIPQVTLGTVALEPDRMCPHIPEANRSHPANVGRTVRCAACYVAAHPKRRPGKPRRFVGSIAELKVIAAAVRDGRADSPPLGDAAAEGADCPRVSVPADAARGGGAACRDEVGDMTPREEQAGARVPAHPRIAGAP